MSGNQFKLQLKSLWRQLYCQANDEVQISPDNVQKSWFELMCTDSISKSELFFQISQDSLLGPLWIKLWQDRAMAHQLNFLSELWVLEKDCPSHLRVHGRTRNSYISFQVLACNCYEFLTELGPQKIFVLANNVGNDERSSDDVFGAEFLTLKEDIPWHKVDFLHDFKDKFAQYANM